MLSKNCFFILNVLIFLSVMFGADDKFYNYYEKGLQYMKAGDYDRAIVELKSAYSLQFEDIKRKRTYGTKFIEYFPHRETGISHYYLEEYDNARQELELSISYKASDRAEEYLKKIASGITHVSSNRDEELKKLEEQKKILSLEQEKLEKEELRKEKERMIREQKEKEALALIQEQEHREKERIEQEKNLREQKEKEALALNKEREAILRQLEELEKRKFQLDMEASKPNVPLTADPVKINRVGSPLSVAVMPIEYKGASPEISSVTLDKFITTLVKKRRFKVIEREYLDKIMNEQSLGMTGIVDEATAINAGKVIGAEAIIMGKQSMIDGKYHFSVRVIDVETSEAITAGEVTSETEELDRAIEKIAVLLINDMPLFEGTVIKIDEDQVYLDIGTDLGVRKGNKFTLYRKGDEIKHPVSGEVMGYNVTPLGEAVAVNIQERMSIAKIVKQGSVKIGDKAVIK